MTTLSCRLCGTPSLTAVLHLERVPRNIQRLFKSDELGEDRSVSLDVYRCSRCNFVQIPQVLDDDYYDDYLMTTTHSTQMQSYQKAQAECFVARFNLKGKAILEAGCGDGNFLGHLQQAGARVFGVEPSMRFRRLAIERGFNVEGSYVTATGTLKGGPFDGFVTRQVLEHIPDIHDFLQGLRRNLRPGAFGLVEVPSLEKAIKDRRFYDFFPDHVNYFTENTLRAALEINGFAVIETFRGMFDEYNIAIVQPSLECDFSSMQTSIAKIDRDMMAFIKRHRAEGRKIAIWGAGAKGLSVFASADISGVDLLVDGDPHKQGLFAPLSHLQVNAPDTLRSYPEAAVVITAMAYRHEIQRILTKDYGFVGPLAVLGDGLEYVDYLDRPK